MIFNTNVHKKSRFNNIRWWRSYKMNFIKMVTIVAITKLQKHLLILISPSLWYIPLLIFSSVDIKFRISKGAQIRNRNNKVPHLTQDTNGKVTNSQLDITSESQEVSPFPEGDHKAHKNRRAQRHNKRKTEKTPRKIHKSTAFEVINFKMAAILHNGAEYF